MATPCLILFIRELHRDSGECLLWFLTARGGAAAALSCRSDHLTVSVKSKPLSFHITVNLL